MSLDLNSVADLYGQEYYSTGFGGIPYERNNHWLNFFGGIAVEIIRSLRPSSVFDAGCGMGMLVEALWDRGVRAQGIDISSYAIGKVRPDMGHWCKVGNLKEQMQGTYDLVTCIEVLEHMSQADAQSALRNLTNLADTILFSSTPQDFTEPTHINVQPVLYWLEAFAALGFIPDLAFDASFVAPHAFLVRRSDQSVSPAVLTGFSDLLRHRMALVERESRIGRLTAENDALSSLLAELGKSLDAMQLPSANNGLGHLSPSATRGSIETLSERAASHRLGSDEARSSLLQKIDELSASATRAMAQLAERDTEIRSALELLEAPREVVADSDAHQFLRQAADAFRQRFDEKSIAASVLEERAIALDAQLRGRSSQLEQLESERVHLGNRIATLQQDLRNAQSALAVHEQLKASLDSQRYRLSQAESQLDLYRRSLGEIQSSPGWKLVSRYRMWLERARGRRRFVRRYYEPTINWLLRKLALASAGNRTGAASLTTASTTAISVQAVNPSPAAAVSAAPVAGGTVALASTLFAAPAEPELRYADWHERALATEREIETERAIARHLGYAPLLSIILPVYKVPVPILKEAVESVQRQTYTHWELCIAVGVPPTTELAEFCAGLPHQDDRIKVVQLDENGGISHNSNSALKLATGEFAVLLDHDDLLAPNALFEVARALNEDQSIDFLYSDKDQITGDGKEHIDPLFKPGWSPEMMLSANFLTHLCVIRTELLREIGGWRKETDGAQDWDIFLRAASTQACKIRHIPKVLYHWRRIETSVAQRGLDAKPYASAAQVAAVTPWLKHLGWNASLQASPSGYFSVVWEAQALPPVSVIVALGPEHNGDPVRLQQLLADTDYPEFELIIPSSLPCPDADPRIRKVDVPASESQSGRINRLAAKARFPHLVIITEPLRPKNRDWLQQLSGPLASPEIGIVGPKILDQETARIRSAGIAIDHKGSCFEPLSGEAEFAYGLFGGAHWFRNWSAVSGACFAVRAESWRTLGGIGESASIAREDVELCLRLQWERKLRVLYTPYATLLSAGHFNPGWGGLEERSNRAVLLANFPQGDPFFNKNLSVEAGRLCLRNSGAQRSSPPPATNYGKDSQELVRAFDCSPALIKAIKKASAKSRPSELRSATWFLPDFSNPRYGGINTILRTANYFFEQKGVTSTIATIGAMHPAQLQATVEQTYPHLAASANFVSASDYQAIDRLPPSDASICTLWTTAYAALHYTKAERHFYFLQDWEPMFYPAGATSGLVEATFQFGFRGICNTRGVYESYREFGGEAMHFEPCVDPDVFHNRGRSNATSSSPLRLFCYARPGHPRNSFELAAEVLRRLKARFGDRLQILTAGQEWDPAQHGLDGIVQNLGLLGYRETAALYRSCDVGISLMMTRHPSYLPFELMACGALVVANHNRHNEWFFDDRVNCLLTTPTVSCMTEAIEEALLDDKLRAKISTHAANWIHSNHGNWNRSMGAIYQYVSGEAPDRANPS